MFISEVDEENNSSDKTYTVATLFKEEIVENDKSVLSSFDLSTKRDDWQLPSTYWIPKINIQTMLHSLISKIYHRAFFKTFNFYIHNCQRGYAVLPQHLLLP